MKTRVLFVCTGNSARSQIAEGLLRHLTGDRFEVLSAGTHPAGLNPSSVRVMAELGIDISGQRSKSVHEFIGQTFDYIITLCDSAKQSCPFFPGTGQRIHHSFEDPAASLPDERLESFRNVRDQISVWLREFVRDINEA